MQWRAWGSDFDEQYLRVYFGSQDDIVSVYIGIFLILTSSCDDIME